jgi:hypothetical protein
LVIEIEIDVLEVGAIVLGIIEEGITKGKGHVITEHGLVEEVG